MAPCCVGSDSGLSDAVAGDFQVLSYIMASLWGGGKGGDWRAASDFPQTVPGNGVSLPCTGSVKE